MMNSISKRLIGFAMFTAVCGSLLGVQQTAHAGNTVSLGKGVKCYWVLVSSNPATGSYVHKQVCRKGV
jgi:hypothetical protein